MKCHDANVESIDARENVCRNLYHCKICQTQYRWKKKITKAGIGINRLRFFFKYE